MGQGYFARIGASKREKKKIKLKEEIQIVVHQRDMKLFKKRTRIRLHVTIQSKSYNT